MSDVVNSLQDGSDEGYNTGNTGSELSMYNLSATQPSVDHMESNLKLVQESRHGFQKYEAAKIQQKRNKLYVGHGAPLVSEMTQDNVFQVTNVYFSKSTLQMNFDSKG